MKCCFIVLVSFFFLGINSYGQFKKYEKVYVSDGLEYIHFFNDSTLWTSIGDEHKMTNYYINHDSLFIKYEYWQTGPKDTTFHIIKWQDYKILKKSSDSLFLLNPYKYGYKPESWEDTLKFVSLYKVKERITNFQYLKLLYSGPFDATIKVTIDNFRKVMYERKPEGMNRNKKVIRIKGELSKKEFSNFLNILSNSLPSKFTKERSCGIDGAIANFKIAFNGKIITSEGCELKWPQAFLFDYLYRINKNKGLSQTERK